MQDRDLDLLQMARYRTDAEFLPWFAALSADDQGLLIGQLNEIAKERNTFGLDWYSQRIVAIEEWRAMKNGHAA